MSAIVGIYRLDGQAVDQGVLREMLTRLAYRGSDRQDTWRAASVGLGQGMLWTTPESLQEHLPLENDAGDRVLTADARLDNREELIPALGLTGRPPHEITDGALILAAYEKWGEAAPEKLLGDFAFAIWDARRQRLFCARDPMGVKPFFYYHTPRLFLFASEIKALFAVPGIARRLNELRVADYLTRIFEDRTSTFYQHLYRLPGAHQLVVTREGLRTRAYWSLDVSREIRLGSDEAYAEAFRDLLTQAVACRLRSAYPVGLTLSGGLDSSSIACLAGPLLASTGAGPLHTYSAIFPSLASVDQRIDERAFIGAIVARGNFEPHYVEADRFSPLAGILWQEEEPIPAPNLYMDCALFEAAGRHGTRVVLTGNDGDSTVSHGFEYLIELAKRGKAATLYREAAALARRYDVPVKRVLWRMSFRPLVPQPVVTAWRTLRGRNQPSWTRHTAIHPGFAERVVAERAGGLLAQEEAPFRSARDAHFRSINSGLLSYLVELLDKAAARYALEPRFPFFDRRLLEFCLAMPPEQKLSQGWPRAILRRAMANILPEAVQNRPRKGNLSANFKAKLLSRERETIEEIIVRHPEIIEHYHDLPALREAYRRYAAAPAKQEQEALTLFTAVVLALWLRQAGL